MRPNRHSTVIERLTLGQAVRRLVGALLSDLSGHRRRPRARFPKALAPGHGGGAAGSITPDARHPRRRRCRAAGGWLRARGRHARAAQEPAAAGRGIRRDARLQARHPLVVVGALGWETGATLDALRSLGDRAPCSATSPTRLRRALPPLRGVLLPVARRGLRPAGARGDGGGRGGPHLHASLPEVGGDAVEYADRGRSRASRRGSRACWTRLPPPELGALA